MKPTHTPPDSTGVPQPPSSRWALTSLALATLLASLGTSVATVGLPALASRIEEEFRPDLDRVLDAVDRSMEY